MCFVEKHRRCIRLITLLVPLFLVFVGMRVPDFSRPHKPKPLRRAVLEKTSARTIVQSVVKVDVDPDVADVQTIALFSAKEHSPEVQPVFSPVPPLSLSPSLSRAPPLSSPHT